MSDNPDIMAFLIQLRADIDTMTSRFNEGQQRILDRITQLRDEVTVNFGQSDHVRLIANGTRSELRALADVQTSMLRQIHRLQTDVRALKGEP